MSVLLLACLVVGAVSSVASAVPHDGPEFPAVQAEYSTGVKGNKLKWLPRRPAKPIPGQRIAQRPAESWIAQAQAQTPAKSDDNPFANPFGDETSKKDPQKQAAQGKDSPKPDAALPTEPALLKETTPLLPGPTRQEGSASEPAKQKPKVSREVPKMHEDVLAVAQGSEGDCPDPDDLKPINKITNDITAEKGEFPPECSLGDDQYTGRSWTATTFTWKASGLCHKPLYFEDVQLERYGHSWGPYIQPFISGGHFFLTVPVLPYKMGLNPPGECMYTLGYYRPGSCAPYMLDPIPISIRAALAEAGVWTGMAYLIP